MMDRDILRAELERLFELDELLRLSRDLLGFDPQMVGGTAAKASFAGALARHCEANDAVEALCDALLATRPEASSRLTQIRDGGLLSEAPALGQGFGKFSALTPLGEGRLGFCYSASAAGVSYRLKVLNAESQRDRRGLQRFMLQNRLLSGVQHPGLPAQLETGFVDGQAYVAHEYVSGPSLAEQLSKGRSLTLGEVRDWLRSLLGALQALHDKRLAHGDLRAENVLISENAAGREQVVLLDAGSDRLRTRPRLQNGRTELFATIGSPKSVAPEQIRGLVADSRTDVYSLGALLYELLVGSPPFDDKSALAAAFGHLSQAPLSPSARAQSGMLTPELDALVLRMLAKQPNERPQNAAAVLDLLEQLERSSRPPTGDLAPEALEALLERVLRNPRDPEAAQALDAHSGSPEQTRRIAAALSERAAKVGQGHDAQPELALTLLRHAARLCVAWPETRSLAESLYAELVQAAPADPELARAAIELKRRLGKWEELIELLLIQAERAPDAREKALRLGEIGRVYLNELHEPDQALVAFTQACCEDPEDASFASELERLAGGNPEAWVEALQICTAALEEPGLVPARRLALLERMARWWLQRAQRPDMALPCFQAVLAARPDDEPALDGITQLYRQTQRWHELGMVLTSRADAAQNPLLARDLRTEAAELLETQLNDRDNARALYERVLAEDPAHHKAAQQLAGLYERSGDFASLVRLLEQSMLTQHGDEKQRTACRVAELYETQLGDDVQALLGFERVLAEDPAFIEALRGAARLHTKAGRFKELLESLERQVVVSSTPRQKIGLLERIATLHAEEFLDSAQAAHALERLLESDPTNEAAMAALVHHYRNLERWEDTASLYERQLGRLTEPERRLPVLLARARVLEDRIGAKGRAIGAYEAALELVPGQPQALEALAGLHESSGDLDAALRVIEILAETSSNAELSSERWARAAKILQARGQLDSAIERFQRAVDANPRNGSASAALREAFIARGDAPAAVQLIEREVEQTEGALAKAKLAGQMAILLHDKVRDQTRAEESAKLALSLDPTNLDALRVLGDIAFESQRYREASKHYEAMAGRADLLEKAEAARVLVRYVDSLAQTGSTQKALAAMDTLLRLSPEDLPTLERAAQVTFEHGSPARAAELYGQILAHFAANLTAGARARALYRRGEALSRAKQFDEAVQPLEESADLDPSTSEPLSALANVYEAQGKWSELIKVKNRHLDIAVGEQRVELLLEIGEIASSKLGDRTQAAKSLVAALEERPDDRRLLTKLMQLYSEEKDWNKLVEIVLRLAEFVDEPKQRVKYLHTAAIVTARQIGEPERALEYYRQVLELEPGFDKALSECIELQRERGAHDEVERLLRRKLELSSASSDKQGMLEAFDQLGALYERGLGWNDQAIDAYEAAQTLDPENAERRTLLARLYSLDPERHLDKAVDSELTLLRKDPQRVEPYKQLRRLYTETKRADAAWCLCQAMSVLGSAEPDEERFYRRMKSDTAAPAQNALTDEDWLNQLMHPDADPLLTSIFALIEPSVIARRCPSLTELGYDPEWSLNLAENPAPVCQSLFYAAGVLGIPLPPAYENPDDPGGVSFVFAQEPSLVLGLTALRPDVPLQPAAFVSAQKLTYLRPGMYVRHLLASGTALKAWLFAAIRLTAPQFPVAAEVEGAVLEALSALDAGIQGQARDQLTRVVARLVTSDAAIDLKRWVAAVDLTADRAGLVISHDLETAVELVRASEEGASSVPVDERVRELILYAISPDYFQIRRALGIAVDS